MQTRELIIEKALHLFNERGINEVGVREIARELDISPGNLSYHFPKKEDLIRELLDQLKQSNNQLYQVFFQEDITLLSYLSLLQHLFANQYQYRCIYLNVVEIHRNIRRIGFDYRQLSTSRTNTLREIFQILIANEELTPQTSKEDIDSLVGFMSLLNRFWISESVLSFGSATPQEVIGYYLTLVARQLMLFATEKGKSGIAGFMAAAGYTP